MFRRIISTLIAIVYVFNFSYANAEICRMYAVSESNKLNGVKSLFIFPTADKYDVNLPSEIPDVVIIFYERRFDERRFDEKRFEKASVDINTSNYLDSYIKKIFLSNMVMCSYNNEIYYNIKEGGKKIRKNMKVEANVYFKINKISEMSKNIGFPSNYIIDMVYKFYFDVFIRKYVKQIN